MNFSRQRYIWASPGVYAFAIIAIYLLFTMQNSRGSFEHLPQSLNTKRISNISSPDIVQHEIINNFKEKHLNMTKEEDETFISGTQNTPKSYQIILLKIKQNKRKNYFEIQKKSNSDRHEFQNNYQSHRKRRIRNNRNKEINNPRNKRINKRKNTNRGRNPSNIANTKHKTTAKIIEEYIKLPPAPVLYQNFKPVNFIVPNHFIPLYSPPIRTLPPPILYLPPPVIIEEQKPINIFNPINNISMKYIDETNSEKKKNNVNFQITCGGCLTKVFG